MRPSLDRPVAKNWFQTFTSNVTGSNMPLIWLS